jgi:hypothetical protein
MQNDLVVFTKEELILRLKDIVKAGWIPNARHGNHGGIGNTLEQLLGIKENNLPLANAAEWELKAQRLNSSSLTTLFHMEPSPRALRLVPQIFLPNYGWPHTKAGSSYPINEMSFRQTIHAMVRSDRGFKVVIDRAARKVLISFDSKSVDARHKEWLKTVKDRAGLSELDPQPYWGFDDLEHKVGVKLLNCFYVQAAVKKQDKQEFYQFQKIMMLRKFSFNGFLKALEEGNVLVDFDARTHHNHGTKFRMRQNCLPMLDEDSIVIL